MFGPQADEDGGSPRHSRLPQGSSLHTGGVMKHFCSLGAVCVAATLVAACGDITRGQAIDHDRLATFKPGVTTIAEVEQSLGAPLEVTHEAAGDTYLKYLYATA